MNEILLGAFTDELQKIAAAPVGAVQHLGKAVGLTTSKHWPKMLALAGGGVIGWNAKDLSNSLAAVQQLRKRGY